MQLIDFLVLPEEQRSNENAFRLLSSAIEQLGTLNDEILLRLGHRSPNAHPNVTKLSSDELNRMEFILAENRTSLKLLDECLTQSELIMPPTSLQHGANSQARAVLSVISRVPMLQVLCYFEARILIERGEINASLNSARRLFKFGLLLKNSWSDFPLLYLSLQAIRRGYRVVAEIALQSPCDASFISELLKLVKDSRIDCRSYVDSNVAPFWKAVATFFERLPNGASADLLVQELSNSGLIWYFLSQTEKFQNAGPSVHQVPTTTPTKAINDKGIQINSSFEIKTALVPLNSNFDETRTIHILDDAISTLYKECDNEVFQFARYIEISVGSSYRAIKLSDVVSSARRHEVAKVNGHLDIAPAIVPETSGNDVGKLLAADISYTCHGRLTSGCSYFQTTLFCRDIYRVWLAVSEYVANFGSYPPTLETLIDRQTLDQIPIDPFCGKAIRYDPEKREIYAYPEVRRFLLGESLESAQEGGEWRFELTSNNRHGRLLLLFSTKAESTTRRFMGGFKGVRSRFSRFLILQPSTCQGPLPVN